MSIEKDIIDEITDKFSSRKLIIDDLTQYLDNQKEVDSTHYQRLLKHHIKKSTDRIYDYQKMNRDGPDWLNKEEIEILKELRKLCKKELNSLIIDSREDVEKLVWKGSVSLFGYFIVMLLKKNTIKTPLWSGETNYNELSRLLLSHFELKEKTTVDSLSKQINDISNDLASVKKVKADQLFELLEAIT